MKNEPLIERLKEAKIVDDRVLFAKIQVVFSEFGKVLRVASGMQTTAGTDAYLGIYEDELVCYEQSLFGGKPTKEIFRTKLSDISSVEFRKGFLGLSYVLKLRIGERPIKLISTLSRKLQVEAILDEIKQKSVS